ncbi:hypothetical protein HHK36_019076 [Tetracentron sinense]|uniref:Uncharacterized protein n=1 Tax=Tetracentron sinense TaxID=13715 RepID=A0A834YVM6_TETSI|nr:hypothetical protein HHK36_019076 [Tetracentron sinense]
MVMDPHIEEFYGSMNGYKHDTQAVSFGFDQNFINGLKLEDTFLDHNSMGSTLLPRELSNLARSSNDGDSSEDCDFSDIVLKYINQMLMEEDKDEKASMFQESSALQAEERSFYEILGEKYPPSPKKPLPYVGQNAGSPDNSFTGNSSNYSSGISTSNSTLVNPIMIRDLGESKSSHIQTLPVDHTSQSPSSSFSSSNSVSNILDGLVDSPVSTLQCLDAFNVNQSVWQLTRGIEQASKFLPNGRNLIVDLENNGLLPVERKGEVREVAIKAEKKEKDKREYSTNGSRGRKNPHREDMDLEGRSNKQSAVYAEATVMSEMFDNVLLCNKGKGESSLSTLREPLQNGASKNGVKGSNGGKSRGKKQGGKREVVDLRTLLIHCAQAVAADDRRSANELLKQIRQHTSPLGDGSQRLAHYFADGLEARLAGTGTQIYSALMKKRTSTADILKAYHLLLDACPFKKISNFFSNQTIMDVAENATRLHIIDFGIRYGFQWPCLIQRLSARPGGPPKLRITGIDLPQPGFRPAERVEETGRRLANYAERFNVPFEFNAIAQKWETIQIEDLHIDSDELLVVNCLYRFRNILDETVVVDSPRNIVLNLIRKMNPAVFIHGILNGAYSAPFFITRFREAFFHFSALFDMLETNVPREHNERILLEREIYGREALNVIACEGFERVERPETYKQWQVRNLRAGFRQLPLNREILKRARDRLRSSYHKDFLIDEDSQWILQGWKGRIVYALSSWKPGYNA